MTYHLARKEQPLSARESVGTDRTTRAGRATWIMLVAYILFNAALPAYTGWSSGSAGVQSTASLRSGTVTAKGGSGVQIDNQNYALHGSVVVKDDEGRALSLADFGTGDRVKFHVYRGKIDQIIVILPQ